MEATRILREEHDVILRGLDVLSVMASSADRGELPQSDDAAAIIEFIRVFADAAHHHKEEGLLFPAMERAGLPRNGGPIAVMLAEHDEGRSLVAQAAAAIAAPALPADAAQAFGRAAGEFVGLLRHHIIKENEILFNIADARIAPADAASLDAEFEAAVAGQEDERRAQVAALESLEARYIKQVA